MKKSQIVSKYLINSYIFRLKTKTEIINKVLLRILKMSIKLKLEKLNLENISKINMMKYKVRAKN